MRERIFDFVLWCFVVPCFVLGGVVWLIIGALQQLTGH